MKTILEAIRSVGAFDEAAIRVFAEESVGTKYGLKTYDYDQRVLKIIEGAKHQYERMSAERERLIKVVEKLVSQRNDEILNNPIGRKIEDLDQELADIYQETKP